MDNPNVESPLIYVPDIHFGKNIYQTPLAQKYCNFLVKREKKKIKPSDLIGVATPAGILSLVHYNDDYLHLDDFQTSIVNTTSRFVAVAKTRQIGWSRVCIAGRSVAMSLLYKGHQSIITSYNLNEVKEKIEEAKKIIDGLPARIRPKINDHSMMIKFADGGKILSLFSARGYTKADVYADEITYHKSQSQTFKDCIPVIGRHPWNKFFVGATPMGKEDIFYDMFGGNLKKFRHFERHIIFWWDSTFYCNNVPEARLYAHSMTTKQRVEKYGTDFLKDLYISFPEEDFQQEYEVCFNDEKVSFFSYDLIQSRMLWFDEYDQEHLAVNLEDIAEWNEGILYAGFDVGRTKNTSELYVFDLRDYDKDGSKKEKLIQVFHKSFDKTRFKEQEEFLRNFVLMYHSSLGRLQIDRNQIGMYLAENLETEFPNLVVGVNLSNTSKEKMANVAKMCMSEKIIELIPDRETIAHCHSVKQTVTTGGLTKYDTDKNEKHHADRFWAIALACDGAKMQRYAMPSMGFATEDREEEE